MKTLKSDQAVWIAWRQGAFGAWSLGHIGWTDATTLCGEEIPHSAGLAPDEITRCNKCQTHLLEKTVGVPNIAPKQADDPKFTPGPWHIESTCYIDDEHGKPVAKTTGNLKPYQTHGQDEANARLIAAAPELYATGTDALRELERAYAFIEQSYPAPNPMDEYCIAALRAALAKARGE